ncbi:hypothetical protein ACIA5D_03750 [Actinoplanes sp. NPDC051513]|uniref:hypothetical protein n=1 Tax=Actinoplanes sp. NPDC051513 TaxID=3363908 RepID=UPI003789BFEC
MITSIIPVILTHVIACWAVPAAADRRARLLSMPPFRTPIDDRYFEDYEPGSVRPR